MTFLTPIAQRLEAKFATPTERGIIGLVNDVLLLCAEHGVEFECDGERCTLHSRQDASEESCPLTFNRSILRAGLAYISALCKKQSPTSPYGGQGTIVIANEPQKSLEIVFVNTSSEQSLRITPKAVLPGKQNGKLAVSATSVIAH
jgi:hypothetical protein